MLTNYTKLLEEFEGIQDLKKTRIKNKKGVPNNTPFIYYIYLQLLGNDQVVVLLTALNEQIFFIEQVSSSNYLVESSELFLIQ